jgi:hypothetical protein
MLIISESMLLHEPSQLHGPLTAQVFPDPFLMRETIKSALLLEMVTEVGDMVDLENLDVVFFFVRLLIILFSSGRILRL